MKTCVFVPVVLVFLSLSTSQFLQTVDNYDLIYAARQIEQGKPVSIGYVHALLDDVDARDIVCRQDIVKSVMTARFHTLDVLNTASQDAARWQTLIVRAGRYAEKGLVCFPTDGNLWLQLAVIRWAGNAPSDETAKAMTLSQHFAPVETAVLLGRLDMWNRMSPSALDKAEAAAKADILAYSAYFGDQTSPALQSPSHALADLIASTQRDRSDR